MFSNFFSENDLSKLLTMDEVKDHAIELGRHLRLPDEFISEVETFTEHTILFHVLKKFSKTDSPTKNKVADALREIGLHKAAMKVFGKYTWCVDS